MKDNKVNWQSVEIDYRAGIKSLRAMAAEYGVSEGAIRKKAKTYGWIRSLSKQIAQTAERELHIRTAEGEKDTKKVVAANAEVVADVRMGQREDIRRSREIQRLMLDELALQAGPEQVDLLKRLGELMRSEDDKGRDELNDVYMKVISLPERARTMKIIADAQKVLAEMEEKAYQLQKYDDLNHNDPLQSLLQIVSGGTGNGFEPVRDDPDWSSNAAE